MTNTAGTTATGTTGSTGTTVTQTTGAIESTTESSTATAQSTVTSTAGTLPLQLLAPLVPQLLRPLEQRKVPQSHRQLHLNQA